MNEYVAIIHLDRPETRSAGYDRGRGEWAAAVALAANACYDILSGITETSFDAVAGSLMVRFDRARATVADLVRCLEDHGLTITGVAQSPTDTGAFVAGV